MACFLKAFTLRMRTEYRGVKIVKCVRKQQPRNHEKPGETRRNQEKPKGLEETLGMERLASPEFFSFFFFAFYDLGGASFSPVCLIRAGSEAADIWILIFSSVKRYLALTETEYIVK